MNQVTSHLYTDIKSIPIPPTEIKPVLTTHKKTKSISIPTLKPSQFWPEHKNQVNFDLPHKNQVNFDLPHKNQVNSESYTEIKSIFIPHWNQVNFNHPHKNQVNFDAPTKSKSFSDRTQKLSHFQPPS